MRPRGTARVLVSAALFLFVASCDHGVLVPSDDWRNTVYCGDGFCSVPVLTVGGHTFSRIAAGRAHTCALTESGAAYCWGQNSTGQAGTGTLRTHLAPSAVAGGHTFTSISTGSNHTCGVTAASDVYCWGLGDSDQLGTVEVSEECGLVLCAITPVKVATALQFAAVSSGSAHTCAAGANDVYCWGGNLIAQLGNGVQSSGEIAPQSVALPQAATIISTAARHTCALVPTGAAFCWGDGRAGALGSELLDECNEGETIVACALQPTAVQSPAAFARISAGYANTCALAQSGAIYCWGDNALGTLGVSSEQAMSPTPVRVESDETFVDVTVGQAVACGITTAGSVHCWGSNANGRLGAGLSVEYSAEPQPVLSNERFMAIAAGAAHVCALTLSGVAWCWGSYTEGQLGVLF